MTLPASGLTVALTVPTRGVEVAFRVPAGTTLGLVGPNGAGKSTTLAALAGWLIPDTGFAQLHDTVLFDCPVSTAKPRTWVAPQQRRIGYLSQQPRVFPHLSVAENIRYGMPRAGITGRTRQTAATELWLARVGLDGLGNRRARELSGGQAQRVALARVLASDPELILLDEPLSALDPQAAVAMRRLLNDALSGMTTVLVSHQAADLEELAGSIHRLESGS